MSKSSKKGKANTIDCEDSDSKLSVPAREPKNAELVQKSAASTASAALGASMASSASTGVWPKLRETSAPQPTASTVSNAELAKPTAPNVPSTSIWDHSMQTYSLSFPLFLIL